MIYLLKKNHLFFNNYLITNFGKNALNNTKNEIQQNNFKLNQFLFNDFTYFFKLLSKKFFSNKIINFKFSPLNKILFVNKNIKKEFLILYKRTKFIFTVKRNKLRFFTFIFFSLYYKNFFLLLSYFKYFLINKKKQKKFLYNIINTYRALYYYKQNTIHGIQFLMHGTFDRHGRTRKFLYLIGKFKISSITLPILFDWIDFSSKYGTISLKIWIIYKSNYLKKFYDNNKFKITNI